MAKVTRPATLATEFGISESQLARLGVTNVSLNTDTRLFIDPLLLSESAHTEMSKFGRNAYDEHFRKVIKLLKASRNRGDAAWRAAEKLFQFSEISWTCLGYGSTVRGSGFGSELIRSTLETASQIVDIGVEDVDLFMVLALFEEGIGPDRISDMTTNVTLTSLLSFTGRIAATLRIGTSEHNTNHGKLRAPTNPYTGGPLIFVPTDIVRDLPIACDWSDVARVASENEQLRDKVNNSIGKIWASMTRKEKRILKSTALQSKANFNEVLDLIRQVDTSPYNFKDDLNGETFWSGLGDRLGTKYPLNLSRFANRKLAISEVQSVVDEILNQFRDLVENKGMWKELWTDSGKHRKEKAAQRLFFVIAYAYCKANNLDVSPEADSGNGPVDFKISHGFRGKVVIEIKLSTGDVIHGYETQLEIYKRADDTQHGIFLLVDVGGLGKKYMHIQNLRGEARARGERASSIWYVDATKKQSASKRSEPVAPADRYPAAPAAGG